MSKVAVVTGSNKGIGFAIVKGLCQKFHGVVYLTSRDESRGKEVVAKLNDKGLVFIVRIWYDKRALDWYDYKADYFFKMKTVTDNTAHNL